MNRPTTAREALVAEALGDMADLANRLEALVPALEANRQGLSQASKALADQATAFEHRMGVVVQNTQTLAVKHIARRTEDLARVTLDTQTRAMEQAARSLFQTEVDPALQRVVVPLQELAGLVRLGGRPWSLWLTHAATASAASAVTLAWAAWAWIP